MGKKAVIKYFQLLSVLFTLILAVITIVGLYAGDMLPSENIYKAFLCLGLPILIICNIIAVIYWVIRFKLWIIVPIFTLICCWNYVGTFYQIRSKPIESNHGLKIATFNVRSFNKESSGFIGKDILNSMIKHNVDIICFQEYADIISLTQESITKVYKTMYPYAVTGAGDMVIFSKYPIKANKKIDFDGTNNSAMWADIDIEGKIIRVINVHLQTTGISGVLHRMYKRERQGELISKEEKAEVISSSYANQFRIREGQAITVANEIRTYNKSMILCGDFNDTPYSFCYKTLLGGLKDGFIEAGSGWMYTYRGSKAPLRIDYIFHSPDLKCLTYYTDKEIDYSDHYPVFMRIEW